MGKKLFIVIVLLLLILLNTSASAFSLKEWRRSIYQQVKIEAEKSFSDLFQKKVSIKEASGILAGQIVLKEVSLEDILYIPKLTLYFNVFKYLASKGDVAASLTRMNIENGKFNVKQDLFVLPEKEGAPPTAPFRGKIIFKNCRVNYSDKEGTIAVDKIDGEIRLPLLAGKLRFSSGSGDYLNYKISQLNGNLSINNNQLDLMLLSLNLENPALKGKIEGNFKISDAFRSPLISGKIEVIEGNFYGQKFSGQGKLGYKEKLLDFQIEKILIYEGLVTAGGQVDFREKIPYLSAEAKFKEIDLTKLSKDSPLIVGRAEGKILAIGNTSELQGGLSATFSSALVFGQPLETLEASFNVQNGKIILKNFQAKSKTVFLACLGEIFPKLSIDLTGEVQEINLSGKLGIDAPTQIKILSKNTNADLSGTFHQDQTIDFNLKGILDLSDFKNMLEKYGRFEGKTNLNLTAKGVLSNPQILSSLDIENLRFNEIYLDLISGEAIYQEKQLLPSLFIRQKNNSYTLEGAINLAGLLQGKPEETFLALTLKIIEGDFSPTYILAEKIQGEISRRFILPKKGGRASLNLTQFLLPTFTDFLRNGKISFYQSNGEKKYFLKSWGKILEDFEKRITAIPEENLGGSISGNLELRGKAGRLSGKLEAEINQGFYRNYSFNQLLLSASLESGIISINKIKLLKDEGNIAAQGILKLDGNLDMQISACEMPIDILTLFTKKEFQGRFNMNSSFSGTFDNPAFSLAINAADVALAGIPFKKLLLSISKKDGNIYIHDLFLQNEKEISGGYGYFSTEPQGEINLDFDLEGNGLGLFNLFSEEIRWLKGKSKVKIKVDGSVNKPKISGAISLSETSIYVKAFDSNIEKIEGVAEIEKNILKIQRLTGIWYGEKTSYTSNPLEIAGNINLTKLFEKELLEISLVFSPANLTINFPNLYSGGLRIQNFKLEGTLDLALSQGPTLLGEIELEDGIITLPKVEKVKAVFPLNFELMANLRKNVYAISGDIATFDLSNIFLNLEVSGEDLEISGNLASPIFFGKVAVKRGTVTIFNREFALLDAETQKKYYPYDPEKIKENVVAFTGEEGALLNLTLTAAVKVETLKYNEKGEVISREKVIILSHLTGIPGAPKKEKGLEISFVSFAEDKTRIPSEITPASYSEQEIKVMLLPDFIKALTGISEGKEAQVDANVVFADYLTSRLQTLVFRKVEREIERMLGLESLTLEYNFGKDVRQSLGITSKEEKPAWGVGFAKGLFDRLYIDVRYVQGMEETGTSKTTFNYQLTYKLSPIWSIIYYREPLSVTELTTGYQKMTLKAKVSFW